MIDHPEFYSHFRNGRRLLVSDGEDQRIDYLDKTTRRKHFGVTLTSYLARTSRTQRDALLTDPAIRDFLFDGDISLEIAIPDNRRLIKTGLSESSISHAKKRAFAELPSIFQPIVENNVRSKKSYRCELAAIVIATYGKRSSIPKATWKKIEKIFGNEILKDSETAIYRRQMGVKEAKNWFHHLGDVEEIFDFSELNKDNVISLVA